MNSLISQTTALQLNLWLSPDLATLPMVTNVLTYTSSDGCGDGLPYGNYHYDTFDQDVYDYLDANYTLTPQGVLDMCNDALAGILYADPPSLDAMAEAADFFNENFDECMVGTFESVWPAVPPLADSPATDPETEIVAGPNAEESDIYLFAYPNPFKSTATIEFSVPEDTRVTLDIYNLTGVKIGTLYEGFVTAGLKYNLEFEGTGHVRQATYVYVLRTNDAVSIGRLMMIR